MAPLQHASRFEHPGGLDELLAEARGDSAEFPDVLANHLPMILVALHRLGASDERLAAYADSYRATNGLVAPPSRVAPIARDGWTAALGDRTRESDYRAFFEAEVGRLGIPGALACYLPRLAPGVGASALHPLMRLAYGVMRRDPREVGTALGYWAACYLPLPPATGATPITDDPAVVLARIGAMPGLHDFPPFSHLWHEIRTCGADPDFAPVVDWLRIDRTTLARVAATSLALFAGTMQFSALHAVTGAHWVRLVGSACDDPRLLRSFWQVAAALVPGLGFPTLPDADTLEGWRRLPCPDWPVIKAQAVASADEHDISLVFSASEEEAVYGDRLYRVVAARRVGLLA